jgi:hypothetical protein
MGGKEEVKSEIESYLQNEGDATTNQILEHLKEDTDLDMSDSTDNHRFAHEVLDEELGSIEEIGRSGTYTA